MWKSKKELGDFIVKKSKKSYGAGDERVLITSGVAAIVTVVLTLFLIIGKMTYVYIADQTVHTWDVVLLMFIIIVFGLANREDKSYGVPTLNGEPSYGKKEKHNRIKKYIMNAWTFSVGMNVLDVIAVYVLKDKTLFYEWFSDVTGVWGVVVNILCNLVSLFVVAVVMDYFIGEHKAKKYGKYLDSLEEDDTLDL